MLNDKDRTWIECHFTKLHEKIEKLQVDVATLKVKAGIFGIIGGAIPVLITVIIYICVRN